MTLALKNIGTVAALKKAKYFCAYQERNHIEVKQKLYSYGLYKNEVEALLSQLIEENYLNEERYAIAFAGGKFRINHWGKQKIKYELQQKKVSEYCIKKALKSIKDLDYENTILKLGTEKLKALRTEKNIFTKRAKLQNYLVGKGYEFDLVNEIIKKLIDKIK